MSKELLQKVIDKGVEDHLNEFFEDASNRYTKIGDNLSEYDGNGFSNFQRIGEINFESSEKLVVVTTNIAGDLTERSGKKVQYEKAKKILKKYMRYDAGIFVFSDQAGNFRLSLVYGTPDATRLVWSNFRRFTYFVNSLQTNKTFLQRIDGCDFSGLNKIKDAFSVEKVTKDFYKKIADWYFWAVQNVTFPKEAEQETNGRNNAVIRLITRLVFIWFMKERGLASPNLFDLSKIEKLLKDTSPEKSTYYQAILQNLFFATLNTKIDERKFRFARSFQGRNDDYMNHGIYRYEKYFYLQEDMLEIFKDIPFLNGGLFDCLDRRINEDGKNVEIRIDGFTDKEVGLSVPNLLFFSDEMEADLNEDYGTENKKYYVQGLLNILSFYNFTIDENDPNDQEVALDPELLGKVFENLLASFNPETATTARKATGSYYTPREIVDYMVTQSLKQYYKTHLENIADIENKLVKLFSTAEEDQINPFGDVDTKRIVQLTDGLRIVDPAVGSGAFPMGILNKLVFILSKLDPNNKLWKEAQLKVVEKLTDPIFKQQARSQLEVRFSEKNSNYGRKLYLIEKCIYGVDIQQIAIEIAKLRFFIALLVDEKIDKSKPNWGIEPLPNLDFKLMQGNSLLSEFMGIDFDAEDKMNTNFKFDMDEMDDLISQFRAKKGEFQNQADWNQKKALKTEVENLINRIFEGKLQNQKAEYLSKLKAIEKKYSIISNIQQRNESIQKDTKTLNNNYKFDLGSVEKQLREFTSGFKVRPFFAWKLYFSEVFHEKDGFDIVIANPPYIRQESLDDKDYYARHYSSYHGMADIYTYFVEKGFNLLREKGMLSYITSNRFSHTNYGVNLRDFLSKKGLIEIVNLNGTAIFENANVDTLIMFVQNGMERNEKFKVSNIDINQRIDGSFVDLIKSNSINVSSKYFGKNNWSFYPDEVLIIKDKMEKKGIALCDIKGIKINRGITTGLNEIFIVDQNIKDGLVDEDPNCDVIFKPILKGAHIKRWYLNWANSYLIYTCTDVDIGKYPSVYRYLSSHKVELSHVWEAKEGKKKWYELRGCNYYSEFENKKIVYTRLSNINTFAISNNGEFCLDSAGIIVTNDNKYFCAILNSKIIHFYFKLVCVVWGKDGMKWFGNSFDRLPIVQIDQKGHLFVSIHKDILRIVDQILVIRAKDPGTNITSLEYEIDQLVYKLYGLTPEEIAIVEGSPK